jgi:DNA-binding NarL/FixJ family response regulator
MGSRLCGGREDGMTPERRPGDKANATPEASLSATRARRVRVLIADEQRLFGEAIEIAIQTDERLRSIGFALDGGELLRDAAVVQPDVIVVQAELPWLDGLEALHHLRLLCPDTRVVIVSDSGCDREHARALTAGAVACVSKHDGVNELVEAIVAASEPPAPHLLHERLGQVFRA